MVAAAHAGIESLSRRYRELLQSLTPGEQLRAERALGRRVVDLKRLASLLPKIPAASVESTPDRAAGGGAPENRRITGVSWSHDRRAPARQAGRRRRRGVVVRRCGEATTHNIVAMVGSEPKQVLCQVCGSRHTHRTGPARRPTAGGAAATPGEDRPRAADPEAQGGPRSCARWAKKLQPPPPFASSIRRSATRLVRSSSTPSTGAERSRTCCAPACWSASRSAASSR